MPKTTKNKNPIIALSYRNFRLLLISRFLAALGGQMISAAVCWEIYARTHSLLALGAIGLIEIITVLLFSLRYGEALDDFLDGCSCKFISLLTRGCLALCSLALGLVLLRSLFDPALSIYIFVLGIAIANAVARPANSTLIDIPESLYSKAAIWDRNSWLLAAALGPVVGGLVIAHFGDSTAVYFVNAGILLICMVFTAAIRSSKEMRTGNTIIRESLEVGYEFLCENPLLLAVVTLDLFVVLFGGATILLPIFARTVLHVGPIGFGWLRATPSIGAMLMTLFLAHRPPFRRAGRTLLWAVAGGGAVTIVFGLSRSFPLSLAMLFVLGALNIISVIVRNALMTTDVPDEMRGHVSAINSTLIGAGNGLGIFESGAVASLFSTPLGSVISVVGGGIGAIVVVLCCALIWPEVCNLGTLRRPQK